MLPAYMTYAQRDVLHMSLGLGSWQVYDQAVILEKSEHEYF